MTKLPTLSADGNDTIRSILTNSGRDAFAFRNEDVVTAATREHEQRADRYNAERVHLSGWSHRRMVREQVGRTRDAAIAAWPHTIY